MGEPSEQLISVTHPSDVAVVRRMGKASALAIGFDEQATEEIVIALSEIASNIVKHASGGTIALTPLVRPAGIEIVAQDCGRGIAALDQAMRDGFSTAGGLGYGLGAVNRLMDDLDISASAGATKGLRVVCRRWLRQYPRSTVRCPLAFGVATRPRLGEAVNGDSFIVRRWETSALAGIIDGLGHGVHANYAAETARQYVDSHFDQPLAAVFRGTARACAATRGVVMALARFDWTESRLTFAAVGNIEARVLGTPHPIGFVVRRGIIGCNAPDPVVTMHQWDSANLFVLHSDGLRTHWSWEDFAEYTEKPATAIAYHLLHALARDDDDATVVVVHRDRS